MGSEYSDYYVPNKSNNSSQLGRYWLYLKLRLRFAAAAAAVGVISVVLLCTASQAKKIDESAKDSSDICWTPKPCPGTYKRTQTTHEVSVEKHIRHRQR